MRPSFVGIGAQKCASSWIYDILLDHPEVSMSETKELDFFSYHYEHGFGWYERHFKERPEVKLCGEVSPSYFHDPRCPERVARYNDKAKLVLSLRNPVERALSHHRHEVRIGTYHGPDYSFEAGLEQNPTYLEQGLYATHLTNWLSYFPSHQILIVLLDDIQIDPAAVARKLYEFLGIEESHVSGSISIKSNPSYVVRNKRFEYGVRAVKKLINTAGLGGAWSLLAKTHLRSAYRKYNRVPSCTIIPPAQKETVDRLREYFMPEITKLQGMTGISLKAWM